jgi:asparagine synthase (glutamine-hydrolysing)
VCGICGFFNPHRLSSKEWMQSVSHQMTDALVHRGPDDFGVWADPQTGAALGHRRLSIQDLSSEGHQPMVSACARFLISYNGEVYNFKELRKQLEHQGFQFRGHSDTEVLLGAITEWGLEKSLGKIIGMFAFALWDREQESLTLVRDPVGKKPLYYGWCKNTFLFGSELKALRAHPEFNAPIDPDALGLFIKYSWVPTPFCIYKGIRKLPPGHLMTINSKSTLEDTIPRPYWSARTVAENGEQTPFIGSLEDATDELEKLLKNTVSCRMIADVSVGALLSGGIDSTMVISMMQSMSTIPIKTFSIGFWESEYNEAQYAQDIARHLGTDHTELYISPKDALAVIPELPKIYDEPFADSSQIPTFLLSKLARKEVQVALSGDGGDELFAGYTKYPESLRRWETWGNRPLWSRQGLAEVMTSVGQASWNLLGSTRNLEAGKIPKWQKFFGRIEKKSRWIPAVSPVDLVARRNARCRRIQDYVLHAEDRDCLLTNSRDWAAVSNPIQGMMHLDFMTFLTNDILVKVDRASMSVSLEVRCPLLDTRLVEFAWSLPLSMRLMGNTGKIVLRKVLERYVPHELTERPKMGFAVPVSDWMKGPLRDWAEHLLNAPRLREQGFLAPKAVQRIWQQHLSGWQDHDKLLWSLLMFQAWHEESMK